MVGVAVRLVLVVAAVVVVVAESRAQAALEIHLVQVPVKETTVALPMQPLTQVVQAAAVLAQEGRQQVLIRGRLAVLAERLLFLVQQ